MSTHVIGATRNPFRTFRTQRTRPLAVGRIPIFRGFACQISLLALLAGTFPNSACASTITVPDDVPTVQLGIDSGADTVQIRSGSYQERPLVDHPVALLGVTGDPRPRLAGLQVHNTNFWASRRIFTAQSLNISGPIEYSTMYYIPRALELSFTECSLDSGFYMLRNTDPDDILALSFLRSRLTGHSSGRVFTVSMDADTVDGSVAWAVHEASIQHCWFRGGPGHAVVLSDTPRPGAMANNRIEHYRVGIYVEGGDPYYIADNTFRQCGTAIQIGGGWDIAVADNDIRDCGVGIDALRVEGLVARNNRILGVTGSGVVTTTVAGLLAENNIVGRCGGAGFAVDSPKKSGSLPYPLGALLVGNTIFANGRSGIELTRAPSFPVYPMAAHRNASIGNGAWGISVPQGESIELGCNDWFANSRGSVSGTVADSTDLGVDPRFCSIEDDDASLDSGSTLVDAVGCGQIGALGVGCGVTQTIVEMLTVESHGDAAEITWRFGAIQPTNTWVERSVTEVGPWVRVVGALRRDGRTYAQEDEHVNEGVAYWYRIGWMEGDRAVYAGGITYRRDRTPPGSRVFPNPSRGPITIEWTLSAPADIEIGVYDVAGRQVAVPVQGRFAAGMWSSQWDGARPTGEPAPNGWYLVRLKGGGLDGVHRVLLLR